MLALLLKFVFIAIFVLMVVTQIIIPGAKNRPFFPTFRRRKIERDLLIAHDLVDQAKTEAEIAKEVDRAAKISRRR